MEIIVRSALLYIFVFIVLRAMGRKELSEMSSFDLVMLIVLGDLIQQGVTGDDRSVTGAMLGVGTFALLAVAFSYLSFKSRTAQSVLQGTPVIVIRDGKPLQQTLSIERLTQEELEDAAREQGIADLRMIRIGVLEADGKFSFLKATEDDSPRPQERKAE